MAPLGNTDLRVAVIGLGRSDAHTAGYLLANAELGLRVDVLETGRGMDRDDLLASYQAVIYALGEPGDRPLTVPGAELAGCTTATAFRGWLSGGGADDDAIDLSCRRAVLVGDNDTALGLAGMLARGTQPPSGTEVATAAVAAFARNAIEEVVVVGRAGPEQTAFSPAELRALSESAEVVADATEVAVPGPYREAGPDQRTQDSLALLQEYAGRPRRGDRRWVALRFLLSPTRILGAGRVQAVELARNVLDRGADGQLRVQATTARATIPAGLVVSAEREHRRPVPPGVPVDAAGAILTDDHGRVLTTDGRPTREYVSEGPALDTVRVLVHDVSSGRLSAPA
jgi:ferredoxin/flavodoxin---NADP+ reductase